ncbi:MAG: endonuclease domain-containing protein [Promethearchaeota archaeon]
MVRERYEDMLDYRLKQLEKSKKAERESSSFFIVTSNKDRKTTKYSSFEMIPIEIRSDEKNFEILKIRYELQKLKTLKSNMFAPRIVQRIGYSYFEKLLYTLLIKKGYKENVDFTHLYSIEGKDYVLDFAFVAEKIDVECDGEPWHEKCRKPEEDKMRDEFLKNHGWKILRFKFKPQDLKSNLLNAIRQIELELKKVRNLAYNK